MPSDTSIAVHIVTWNSISHIPFCLDALQKQTLSIPNVLIVDNASVDGTVQWIEEHFPHYHLLRNTRNLGYCRAHNQALRITKSEFVLLLNPDVILEPDWIARGLHFLTTHPEYGAFGGKILRHTYTTDDLKEVVKSGIIDSTGLQVFRNRHTIDRGSGEEDNAQFNQAEQVFGFSGACVLYRRSAIESIGWKDEYLDNDLFAYKDDLDVSWRLQRMGWCAWYDPSARAYHYRQIKGASTTSDRLIAKNHRSRTRFNSYYSYRNHWLVLLKNEQWQTFWRDLPWIAVYEIKKLIFLTMTGKPSVAALASAWKLWPKMRQKSLMLSHHAERPALEIRRWFLK